jgi:hypothetical protein
LVFAKQRQTTPIGQRAEIAQELQSKASPYFAFYEFRLTRRAKQWHYAIMGFSKAVRRASYRPETEAPR